MPKGAKISTPWVDGLPLATDSKKPVFYWDSVDKGFAVKVSKTRKRYIAEAPVYGETVRVDLGGHPGLDAKKARIAARIAFGQMHDGINPNNERRAKREKGRVFREICEEYLECKPIGERTRRDYRYHMGRTVVELMDRPYLKVSRSEIEKLYIEKAGATGSPAQANQAFRFVNAVFRFATRYRDADGKSPLLENPVTVLSEHKLWRRVVKRTRHVKQEQLRPVWEALWQLRNDNKSQDRETIRDLYLVLFFTGMRISEAQNLKWTDLDFDSRIISLEITKNHLPHVIPWSDYLEALFIRRREARGKSRWVFPSTRLEGKKPIQEPDKQLKRIVIHSGVQFSAHDIRRTFLTATSYIEQRYNAYLIKRLVNHKVADVTAGYIQFNLEDIRRCMQQITDYILEHCEARRTRIGMLSPPTPPVPQKRNIRIRKPETITVLVAG
ncbi:MAG: tyrosine-type recombinase/integrase [Rhodocyclaceae bacterium]|nr:tyrosine-type recombinase/integrase [Rhodocyclaceae bacterium]